ncbi:MAG: methyltransferase domain-containing protein, partial [Patescibacteria group bacterium]
QLFSFYCRFHHIQPLVDLDSNLKIHSFFPSRIPSHLDERSSPSRILSNLFWRDLPWNQITEELGNLTILDTGCGSGSYGDYLNECSAGKVKQYVGLDVYEHASWKSPHTLNKQFHLFDGKSITPYIPNETNFFMSQSAVEHFANDRHYFEEIAQFIQTHSQPIIQVHLFPSVACMKLYGRHGYRQYTPRTVSHITRLFPTSECFLFGLGGPASNRVHNEYITQPLATDGVDYRKTKPEEYQQKVLQAIQTDKNIAPTDPSFWALVICSNWKKPFVV